MYLQLVAEEADHQSADSEGDTIDYRELEARGQLTLPYPQDEDYS